MGRFYFSKKNRENCIRYIQNSFENDKPEKTLLYLKSQGLHKAALNACEKLLTHNNPDRAVKLLKASGGSGILSKVLILLIPLTVLVALFTPYVRDFIVDVEPILARINHTPEIRAQLGDDIETAWGLGVVGYESGPSGSQWHYMGPISGSRGRGTLKYAHTGKYGLNSSHLSVEINGRNYSVR
jgi:hypothetical protein